MNKKVGMLLQKSADTRGVEKYWNKNEKHFFK